MWKSMKRKRYDIKFLYGSVSYTVTEENTDE